MEEGKTFYELALEDVPELEVLPDGEYRVQITDASIGSSDKTGGDYLLLRLEVPSEELSKEFTDVFMFPTSEDSAKQRIKRLSRIKQFCNAVGYDSSLNGGIETEELIGLEGWAYLTTEESSDYGEQNRVKKWEEGN